LALLASWRCAPMLLVGLTGGIASGKSTVASMFAARGAAVVDADRITRELQAPGTACHRAILETFGEAVRDAQGGLDRRRLASRVFGDAAERARLEALMHPAIWARVTAEAAAAAGAGHRVCLVDAAVIFEAGWAERFPVLIVVTAPADVQLARLRARGLEPAEASRRLRAQWPSADKAARADFVIRTEGTLAETEAQVARIHAALLADPRSR
ncbi:MAG: dephospho-CoA kinase, partial [Candidatus Methylomirabilales bacterium]